MLDAFESFFTKSCFHFLLIALSLKCGAVSRVLFNYTLNTFHVPTTMT